MLSTDEVIWFGQGMVKEPMEDVAELRAVLGGLQKAHENGVLDLVLCLRPELLQQVPIRVFLSSACAACMLTIRSKVVMSFAAWQPCSAGQSNPSHDSLQQV